MVWRIDAGGTVPTLPTIPAAGTEAFYSGGNQATGTPATIVPAWWMGDPERRRRRGDRSEQE
jgi:hypothetical protein